MAKTAKAPLKFVDDDGIKSVAVISRMFKMDWKTAKKVIEENGIKSVGTHGKAHLYVVREFSDAMYKTTKDYKDPDDLRPRERVDHFAAILKRLEVEERERQLIPVDEVRQDMAEVLRALSLEISIHPDMCEKDEGTDKEAIELQVKLCDNLQNKLAAIIGE